LVTWRMGALIKKSLRGTSTSLPVHQTGSCLALHCNADGFRILVISNISLTHDLRRCHRQFLGTFMLLPFSTLAMMNFHILYFLVPLILGRPRLPMHSTDSLICLSIISSVKLWYQRELGLTRDRSKSASASWQQLRQIMGMKCLSYNQ